MVGGLGFSLSRSKNVTVALLRKAETLSSALWVLLIVRVSEMKHCRVFQVTITWGGGWEMSG